MPEDRLLQALQLLARLEPELLDEKRPPLPVGLQGLGLPTAAVQRQHQLRPQPLTQRVPCDERLELADEVLVPSEVEVDRDPLFEHDEPPFVQARRLRPDPRGEVEVAERSAAPERESLGERSRGGGQILRVTCGAGRPDESLERVEVELPVADADGVATRAGRESPVRPVSELPTQLGDVVLDDLEGGRRRALSPQLVDEPVAPDHLVRVEEQEREQRPLLRAADTERTPVVPDFQ